MVADLAYLYLKHPLMLPSSTDLRAAPLSALACRDKRPLVILNASIRTLIGSEMNVCVSRSVLSCTLRQRCSGSNVTSRTDQLARYWRLSWLPAGWLLDTPRPLPQTAPAMFMMSLGTCGPRHAETSFGQCSAGMREAKTEQP